MSVLRCSQIYIIQMDKKGHIELLDRFFRGLTSQEDDRILKEWIKQPNFREDFNEYYLECWSLAPDVMDRTIQDEMFAEIMNKINSEPKAEVSRNFIQRLPVHFLRYAVAACLIIAVGVGAYFLGNNQTGPGRGLVTLTVKNGQKADVTLADGTKVYINSDSRITYDNSYNKKDRVLVLEGEAYFDVAKDKKRPFIVKANGIDVLAVGTSFNVKAHAGDKSVSVILLEGKVRVNDDKQERFLDPNERLEYNLATGEFEQSQLHPNENYLLWRSKELAFYGESLEEICNSLTRMYNCRFVFRSESARHFTYNGIIKNNSLGNVLDILSQTTSVRYEMLSDNTIVIY